MLFDFFSLIFVLLEKNKEAVKQFIINIKTRLKELYKMFIFADMDHKLVYIAFVILVSFVLFISVLSSESLLDYVRASFIVSSQKEEIERYNKEIRYMDKKINNLSQDKDSLERFARENFMFSCPDEDVFLVEED